jgi:pentose-5-phosphate-3-epimerase
VYSGAGGQKFMSGVVEKVKDGRRYVEGKPFRLLFGVDGGVNDATIVQVRGLVDYVVAGSYVVKSDSKVAIASLRG